MTAFIALGYLKRVNIKLSESFERWNDFISILIPKSCTAITNLSAVFTEPGQYVVYSFYAYNTGRYDAYLNDVTFKNIDGKNVNKECIALPGTRDDLVRQVCGDIQITVQVGSAIFKQTTNKIQNHILNRNAAEVVTIKFTYVNNDHYADGDFEIDFGDITLNYSSVD